MNAIVSGSCKGGPSAKPKVVLYVSAKKLIRVDSVWRTLPVEAPPEESNRACTADVAIAVCVTLIGIMIFLTGTSNNICAASAGTSVRLAECLYQAEPTVTQDVVFCIPQISEMESPEAKISPPATAERFPKPTPPPMKTNC